MHCVIIQSKLELIKSSINTQKQNKKKKTITRLHTRDQEIACGHTRCLINTQLSISCLAKHYLYLLC